MEPIVWMSLGAAGVVGLIIMRLAARHGWAWVQARLRQHTATAEADFKAKVTAVAGDLAPRVADLERKMTSAIDGELAAVKADVAALKTKVGV
jgi:NAD(P)-dependent dehydrogenase (short-subunit alcohol dehydrogenase family)